MKTSRYILLNLLLTLSFVTVTVCFLLITVEKLAVPSDKPPAIRFFFEKTCIDVKWEKCFWKAKWYMNTHHDYIEGEFTPQWQKMRGEWMEYFKLWGYKDAAGYKETGRSLQ